MSEKIENPSAPVGFKVKAFDSAGISRMVVMDKGKLEMEPVQFQDGENVDVSWMKLNVLRWRKYSDGLKSISIG